MEKCSVPIITMTGFFLTAFCFLARHLASSGASALDGPALLTHYLNSQKVPCLKNAHLLVR